ERCDRGYADGRDGGGCYAGSSCYVVECISQARERGGRALDPRGREKAGVAADVVVSQVRLGDAALGCERNGVRGGPARSSGFAGRELVGVSNATDLLVELVPAGRGGLRGIACLLDTGGGGLACGTRAREPLLELVPHPVDATAGLDGAVHLGDK